MKTIHVHWIDVEDPGRVRALVLSFVGLHRLTLRQIAFARRAVKKGWVGSRPEDLPALESLRETVARHLEPGADQDQSRGLLKMLDAAIKNSHRVERGRAETGDRPTTAAFAPG